MTSGKKKQIPPDKTRDSRHLSGARRLARNDNLWVFRGVAFELAKGSVVGRGSAVLRVEGGLVVGWRRKLETRLGRAVVVEPGLREVASGEREEKAGSSLRSE